MSDWAFIEHVTDYLTKPRIGDQRHPTLWPSEASAEITNEFNEKVVIGKCRRATFFRYLQDNFRFYDKYNFYSALVDEISLKKLPPDRYMRWIWKAGELYEEYLINLAKSSGVFIGEQIPIYIKSHNVSGKIDLRVINPVTHKLTDVEAKSVYGHGGNYTLGTPSARRKGQLGTPRDSNMMQIGIYNWWTSSANDSFESSRLVYGARDTGRYAEYLIHTEKDENDDLTYIYYTNNAPNQGDAVKTAITIDNILEQYASTQRHLDSGEIPERDYELAYDEDRIDLMLERGQLNKAETERHTKRQKWKAGEHPRKIKLIEKGDWQCRLCSFKNICYEASGEPRTL